MAIVGNVGYGSPYEFESRKWVLGVFCRGHVRGAFSPTPVAISAPDEWTPRFFELALFSSRSRLPKLRVCSHRRISRSLHSRVGDARSNPAEFTAARESLQGLAGVPQDFELKLEDLSPLSGQSTGRQLFLKVTFCSLQLTLQFLGEATYPRPTLGPLSTGRSPWRFGHISSLRLTP